MRREVEQLLQAIDKLEMAALALSISRVDQATYRAEELKDAVKEMRKLLRSESMREYLTKDDP